MIRSKTIKLVHDAWKDYQAGGQAGVILKRLVIACLAEQEYKVFLHLLNLDGNAASSDEIAARFVWSINHASTMLKRLHELGLVQREEVTSTQGKRFLYWIGE